MGKADYLRTAGLLAQARSKGRGRSALSLL
jgi:hypothetical protein